MSGGLFTNGFIQAIGDPEWIGILERPDAPHGPNNKFLSRYAFVALPAGNTLDLNAIHNQALHGNASTMVNPPAIGDTYFRNQGVGTWEINLAAFLADLNTNEWGQFVGQRACAHWFRQLLSAIQPVSSCEFRPRLRRRPHLLTWRYNNDYNSLATFSVLYFRMYPLGGGPVDMFPFGPVMTNTIPFYNYGLNNSWPGADNTNHYFELSADLFDPNKTELGIDALPNFIDHLQFITTNIPTTTYNAYTFYRLLAQLGTDSAPETGKLNVNYQNTDAAGNVVPDMETNLSPWNPTVFFNAAADRMLRAYTAKWFQAGPSNYLATYYGIHTNYFYTDVNGDVHTNDLNGLGLVNALGVPNILGMTSDGIPAFGVTNIPVSMNGFFTYTPAIHRVLQLAANILDATTNNTLTMGKDFPSVFRPIFSRHLDGNLIVYGYTNVASVPNGAADIALSAPFEPSKVATAGGNSVVLNVYGVPWIIGAKKGFPAFNEISMQDVVSISRKLQVTRSDPTATATMVATNAQYIMSINNSIGIEFWNSYINGFTNPVQVVVYDNVSMNLTNESGWSSGTRYYSPTQVGGNFTIWPGSTWNNDRTTLSTNASYPFYIPINTTLEFMTNQVYQWDGSGFKDVANARWEATTELLLPHFGLLLTNRLQAFILATGSKDGLQHVIDYVHFNGPDNQRDLNAEIQTSLKTSSYANMWDTNLNGY